MGSEAFLNSLWLHRYGTVATTSSIAVEFLKHRPRLRPCLSRTKLHQTRLHPLDSAPSEPPAIHLPVY
ncbi:hypothetical protein SKAU_G00057060 [Synaphobranchus kaupii]|uniref:Uncharacterized protein n=1 Tax=Synaphobranchus kaupii TaxID=118154 RepID=A0A9Q1G508_SYNKA|nr:hypothetical protein SKAU_G00057060 [Synaphobranchus kaupii]